MIPLNTALTAVSLAQDIPDPNDVKPGWIGFVVVVLLAVALVVLLLSFRKQLRKVDANPQFDDRAEGGAEKDDHVESNGGAERNGGDKA